MISKKKAEDLVEFFKEIMDIGPSSLAVYMKMAHGIRGSGQSVLGGSAGSQLTLDLQQAAVKLMDAYHNNEADKIHAYAQEVEGYIMTEIVAGHIPEKVGYEWIDQLRSIIKEK